MEEFTNYNEEQSITDNIDIQISNLTPERSPHLKIKNHINQFSVEHNIILKMNHIKSIK